MKYFSLIGMLWVLSLSFSSCVEKPLPEPFEDDVDFFLEGQIDAKALRLDAGKQGYYMYTQREKNQDNLWLFQGQLSPANCQECPSSFAVEFRDVNIRPENEPFDIAAIFRPKSYDFAFIPSLGPQLFKVSYQNQSSGGINPLLQWTFGDGTTSSELNPVKFYEEVDGTSFEVCLTANDGQNCESQICNEVRLAVNSCKADFTTIVDSNFNSVQFESQIQASGNTQYNWSFGDGNNSSFADPVHIYSQAGRYQAQLQIEDSNGCTATHSKLISSDASICTHNFSYEVEKVSSPDSMQFGHVRVLWWDENGQLYRSDWSQQDAESNFEITEVLDYQDNELGQPTIRLGLKLNCWLSNGDHEVRLENATAYLGVALP